MYTYFIISPGAEVGSYVQYSSAKGNYVKFGDAGDTSDGTGIRKAYLTHNPDIGIAAVMDSTAFKDPCLGTKLKNYIISTCKINPVSTAPEWFSVTTGAAWGLFKDMLEWDKKVVSVGDLSALQKTIFSHLS